jgi:two-component system sensor histidine kinase MprB
MSGVKSWKAPFRGAVAPQPSLHDTSSVSLRWRVMLLAMSMVAMVVVLMAVAVYAVVSRALYEDIDSQLQSRARLLIESGSLAADPGKAIEGTAYSDVNAMLVIPGRTIYTANQEGDPADRRPEKDVVQGKLWMSLRTANYQRVLAVHLSNGSSLLISKSLTPTGKVLKRLGEHPAHRRRSRHGGRGDRGWNGRAHGPAAGGDSRRPPSGWRAPRICGPSRYTAAMSWPA